MEATIEKGREFTLGGQYVYVNTNGDMNEYKTPGKYHIVVTMSNYPSNYPDEAQRDLLEVSFSDRGYVLQRLTHMTNGNIRTWARTFDSPNWGAWKEL